MLFVIHCVDKPDSLDLRLSTRPAHVEYLHSRKDVFIGGPTLTDDGAMNGSVLIVEAADRAGAEAFANDDPYCKAGLFASRTITPWRLFTSNFDLAKQ